MYYFRDSVQSSKVHRTCFAIRGRNRSRSHIFPILDILSGSRDIRDQSRKLCKIGPDFAGFFGPKHFWGRYPEFLDLHYKIQPHIDHVAGAVFRPRSTRNCGGRRRWKGPKGSGKNFDEN